MSNEKYIVLLDPALQDNEGKESSNLGDLIISEHNIRLLASLFPGTDLIRLSSHSFLDKKQRELVKNSQFSFVGGSNLLYSDMITYRQFLLRKGKLLWLFPGIKQLILLGVGWGPDQNNKINWRTKQLYRNILYTSYAHSVRDHFTSHKLEKEVAIKTINTSCVSMWGLNGVSTVLNFRSSKCLFTLTDHKQDPINDDKLITLLLEHFQNLYFFPQGSGDLAYIGSLDSYKKNKERFTLLQHSYPVFNDFAGREDFVYIGTRLHGGIQALNKKRKALILAVDNRAGEIAKDTNLPVIRRDEYGKIRQWLNGEDVFGKPVTIPLEKIKQWKEQFS
ncbi:MAG: polysaccharide pyruvyl transferase family protein [Chitinophagaceae bacterium]